MDGSLDLLCLLHQFHYYAMGGFVLDFLSVQFIGSHAKQLMSNNIQIQHIPLKQSCRRVKPQNKNIPCATVEHPLLY